MVCIFFSRSCRSSLSNATACSRSSTTCWYSSCVFSIPSLESYFTNAPALGFLNWTSDSNFWIDCTIKCSKLILNSQIFWNHHNLNILNKILFPICILYNRKSSKCLKILDFLCIFDKHCIHLHFFALCNFNMYVYYTSSWQTLQLPEQESKIMVLFMTCSQAWCVPT